MWLAVIVTASYINLLLCMIMYISDTIQNQSVLWTAISIGFKTEKTMCIV